MKNKKGFTLTELIATIAILGIIVTIASIVVVKVKENTLKAQKENVIGLIKNEAKKYYKETGVTKVPVYLLVDIGSIESDKKNEHGEGVVIDPVTNESMNCGYVDFTDNESGEYHEDGGCTDEIKESFKSDISYTYKKNDSSIISSGEYTGTIATSWFAMASGEHLVFTSSLNEPGLGYSWTTPYAPDLVNFDSTFEIEISSKGYLDDNFRLEVTKSDGTTSISNFHVKADGVMPNISQVYVDDIANWSREKTIHGTFSDNESGLYGYALITSGTCANAKYQKLNGVKNYDYSETITENGTYTLCLKDVSGNTISYGDKIVINKIDRGNINLSVETKDKGNWGKSKQATITLTDTGSKLGEPISGLNASTVEVKYGWSTSALKCSDLTSKTTLTTSDGGITFTGTVTVDSKSGNGKIYVCGLSTTKDRAGNKISDVDNPKTSVMKLDNKKPSGSISINSNKDYNSISAYYKLSNIEDKDSGISGVCVNTTENASKCTWSEAKEDSKINYTISDSEGSGNSYTLYLHVKDNVGNIYTTSDTYELYKICSKTKDYTDPSEAYSACSPECGSGRTKSRTLYKIDKYIDNKNNPCKTIKNGDVVNCNDKTCDTEYNENKYHDCDTYFITTCNSTTCNYIQHNGVNKKGTIALSYLSDNPKCTIKSYCSAYFSSRSGNTLNYTVSPNSGNCVTTKASASGSCVAYNPGSDNKFKVDFAGSSCVVTAYLSGVGYIWHDNAYNYIGWSAKSCGNGKVCTDSCDSGVCN